MLGPSVGARVVDLEAAAAPHGLGDRRAASRSRRRRRLGLAEEADLVAQPLDPPREPLGEDARDLRERVAGGDPAPLGDDEPERDRGRLVVGEHQRRQARAGAEPVAAADAGLAVDRDADVVQRDRVPADRPLGHAEVGGGGAAVDHRPGLEHLEEREQAGGRPGHSPRLYARLRTKTVLNRS